MSDFEANSQAPKAVEEVTAAVPTPQPGCEVQVQVAPAKTAEQLKRALARDSKSASYCCEAAFTVNAEDLPLLEAFR